MTTTARLIAAMTALVRPGDEDAENGRKEEEPHHDQCPVLRAFPVIHRCPSIMSLHRQKRQEARTRALFVIFGPAIPP